MLYLIGIGLNDEKDISIKGLEAVKQCDFVYLENYTSRLQCKTENLEKLYGKKIILADRELVEDETEILSKAKESNVALLIIGDVFSATTHSEIYKEAKKQKIVTQAIFNASVLNAVGITGLQLYKFGKTASIPFHNENVKVPYEAMKNNKKNGLHTLFLLDLNPVNNKYLTIKEAIEYLLRLSIADKENIFTENTKCIACARLGSEDFKIKSGASKQLQETNFGEPPYCFIIPGELHFAEEELLDNWN